jgi:hypothetical protein
MANVLKKALKIKFTQRNNYVLNCRELAKNEIRHRLYTLLQTPFRDGNTLLLLYLSPNRPKPI